MAVDTKAPPRQSRSLDEERVPAEKQDIGHVQVGDAITGYDAAEARKIRLKIDFRLLPILILLYLLAFLDRVNIGNARLYNFESDLGMSGYDYNIAVLVFYIPYILCGIPANMLMTRFRPRYWLSFLTFGWGVSVLATGFCKNMAGIVVVRVLLGVFEAGIFPASMYLINTWYKRHELSTRMAWFMVSTDIAGTISGLLGAALGSLGGVGGYSGWCWIFWVEGAMTIIAAGMAFFLVVDFPEQSTFLKPEEKEWLLASLTADDGRKPNSRMTIKGTLDALKDPKVLASGFMYLGCTVTGYSVAVFAPTILSTFGWSPAKANLMTSPIRAAAAVSTVLTGIASDKTNRRAPFVLGWFTLSVFGNLLVMLMTNTNARYAGLYFTALGVMSIMPLVVAWCVNQVVGHDKRGTSTATAGSMGQIGGIISALAFPKKDGPQYVPGMSINIAFLAMGITTALTMYFWCKKENKARDEGKRDHLRSLSPEEQSNLGERHPDFRFTL